MYSNNILHFQESTTILNACTKILETYRMHHVCISQRALAQSEKWVVSFQIRTLITYSILNDDNHYTKSISGHLMVKFPEHVESFVFYLFLNFYFSLASFFVYFVFIRHYRNLLTFSYLHLYFTYLYIIYDFF